MPTARRIATPMKRATTQSSMSVPISPVSNAGIRTCWVAQPSTHASATVSTPKSTAPERRDREDDGLALDADPQDPEAVESGGAPQLRVVAHRCRPPPRRPVSPLVSCRAQPTNRARLFLGTDTPRIEKRLDPGSIRAIRRRGSGRGRRACAPPAGRRCTCSGRPRSWMRPSCRKQTSSATSRAKPISWVLSSMVTPSALSSVSRSSTSPTSSGSSALVTSSSSISRGLATSARAIATRCCCPPDRSSGRASALAARPTRSSIAIPRDRASSAPTPCTRRSARVTLPITSRCGKRL